MLVALLLVCAESLTLGRLKLKMEALHAEVRRNASNESMDWNTYTSNYCEEFCKMKGVTPGRCTVCEQRMNFSVAEGHVACAVECQGIQTDEVTESVVDCAKTKDECMFKYIEPASCRLECGVEGSKASCKDECHEFKASARAAGDFFTTFHGPNYVDVTKPENVTTEVEVNGTMENQTTVENVTSQEVKGVEPLPTVGPGGIVPVESPPDFRYHEEEVAWKKHTMTYCETYFCNFETVNSYLCVECPNRLNNSVETSLHACHVGCQMHHTDNAGANMTAEELECESGCMTTKFESATCNLECEMEHKPDWVTGTSDRATCRETCKAHKANQRANGKTSGPESDVVPFFWPDPPKPTNGTNGTNGTNASL